VAVSFIGGGNRRTHRLLERVAAKSLDKVRPTKGEFNQDINPEKIQEKLLERYSIIFI
jgi:hypothetical protein